MAAERRRWQVTHWQRVEPEIREQQRNGAEKARSRANWGRSSSRCHVQANAEQMTSLLRLKKKTLLTAWQTPRRSLFAQTPYIRALRMKWSSWAARNTFGSGTAIYINTFNLYVYMSLWSRHYTTEHNKVKYTRTDCVTVLKTYMCVE